MPKAERKATAHWKGNLASGQGVVSGEGGTFPDLEVTWPARTGEDDQKTSPEQLIAAAYASCFSMALSHGLSEAGNEPEALDVDAIASFEQVGEGWKMTTLDVTVEGRVPGIDEGAFQEAAEQARENCPVAQALRGNVEITVAPRLLSS